MKQTILGTTPALARQLVKRRIVCCTAIAVCAVALNTLFLGLRTRENHSLMLFFNILVDVIAGWSCLWQFTNSILPTRKCLRLYNQQGTRIHGTVEAVSEQTQQYMGFDCIMVTVAGRKVFVVDNGSICLMPGETVTVETVNGVVKEVLP